MKKIAERMREINEQLGQDRDVAFKVLTLLLEREMSSDEIATRLGLDPLEAARLVSKLNHLGLVA